MGFWDMFGKKKKKIIPEFDMTKPHVVVRKGKKKGVIDPLGFWGFKKKELKVLGKRCD